MPSDDEAIGESARSVLRGDLRENDARGGLHPRSGFARLKAVAEKRRGTPLSSRCAMGRRTPGRGYRLALVPTNAEGSEAWLPNAADLRHLAVRAQAPWKRDRKRPHGRSGAHRSELGTWTLSACTFAAEHIGVARFYEKRGYVRTPAGDLSLPTVDLEGFVLLIAAPHAI